MRRNHATTWRSFNCAAPSSGTGARCDLGFEIISKAISKARCSPQWSIAPPAVMVAHSGSAGLGTLQDASLQQRDAPAQRAIPVADLWAYYLCLVDSAGPSSGGSVRPSPGRGAFRRGSESENLNPAGRGGRQSPLPAPAPSPGGPACSKSAKTVRGSATPAASFWSVLPSLCSGCGASRPVRRG